VDDSEKFGVTLFGSYQKRDFTSRSATSNDWNIRTFAEFHQPGQRLRPERRRDPDHQRAVEPSTLVAIPNDSRYHFSQGDRERINGQLTAQFRPTESLTITADALYAQNKSTSVATTDQLVQPPVRQGDLRYQPRRRHRRVAAGNAQRHQGHGLRAAVPGQQGLAEVVRPERRLGPVATISRSMSTAISRSRLQARRAERHQLDAVSIGAPIIAAHSVDYSGDIPVQTITINDAAPRGNANGQLDVGDLGSQVGRTNGRSASSRRSRKSASTSLGPGRQRQPLRLRGRLPHLEDDPEQHRQTQQDLGTGASPAPGDVEIRRQPGQGVLPGLPVHDFNPGQTGAGLVSFRGNAVDLYNALSPKSISRGNNPSASPRRTTMRQGRHRGGLRPVHLEGRTGRHDAGQLVTGVRYETDRGHSRPRWCAPQRHLWTADNDFTRIDTDGSAAVGQGQLQQPAAVLGFPRSSLQDNLTGRFSFSRTIARSGLWQPVRRPTRRWAAEPSDRQRGHPAGHQRQPGPGR
jgi:hypothetical protein